MSVYPIVLSQTDFMQRNDLTYPFDERGLQFGDGIYEVIRIYQGSFYLLTDHINRLFRSAAAIKLQLPFSKQTITNKLKELLAKNAMTTDGIVYLQVTRGSAPRTHAFPAADIPPNAYAYIKDMPRKTEELVNGVSAITHRDTRWENCYIKSLNLLPNVLAKQEAQENGCFEAILERDGHVTEGSSANIYLVKNQQIYTHPATNQILSGCVRTRLRQFASDLQYPLVEEAFSSDAIADADELFLTSSTSEVMPIVMVDGKSVARGQPGSITRQLQAAYNEDAQITSIPS